MATVFDAIAQGRPLSSTGLYAFFIPVRDDAAPGSMLRDLGHCFAHADRSSGLTRKYLERFAERLIAALTVPGQHRLEVGVLFPVEQVIRDLAVLGSDLGFTTYPDAMLAHAQPFAMAVAEVLAGTTFDLKRPALTCELSIEPSTRQPMVLFTPRDNSLPEPFARGVATGTALLIAR